MAVSTALAYSRSAGGRSILIRDNEVLPARAQDALAEVLHTWGGAEAIPPPVIFLATEAVTITVAADHDNSLYVLTDCADPTAGTCVAGADVNYQAPFSETHVLSNSTSAPTTYYVVLDSWRQADCGPVTLDITP